MTAQLGTRCSTLLCSSTQWWCFHRLDRSLLVFRGRNRTKILVDNFWCSILSLYGRDPMYKWTCFRRDQLMKLRPNVHRLWKWFRSVDSTISKWGFQKVDKLPLLLHKNTAPILLCLFLEQCVRFLQPPMTSIFSINTGKINFCSIFDVYLFTFWPVLRRIHLTAVQGVDRWRFGTYSCFNWFFSASQIFNFPSSWIIANSFRSGENSFRW